MPGLARKLAATVTVVLIGLGAAALPAAAAPSHTQITGSGSSWAANAVNQWIADVNKQGLQVVFTSTGSAQGRRDWAFKTTDFGVSDIAYQGRDPVTQQEDTSLGRSYAYLPIVAGGTSFPYNLSFAGKRIRNLRLSGKTVAMIFTNQLKYWDDAQIKKDNGRTNLPHIPIIPVVHSEGSGSTYQFTAYLAKQFGGDWGRFLGQNKATEYFPRKGTQQAQSGSDGVMNFITSSAGNGSIGFDEYSYALGANFPVAKVLNSAGYFTAPTQYNVAVALQSAIINQDKSSPNYLTQDLKNVYAAKDKRTYPLSSYSYMIIPTGANETKTGQPAQLQTISDFLYYSICQGQSEMGPIGYSPLPVNLVQDGFAQIAKLKGVNKAVDISKRNVSTCNNPTFTKGNTKVNHLAKIAPLPPACDKVGAGPCAEGAGVVNSNPGSDGSAPVNGSNGGSAAGGRGGSGAGGTTGSGGTAAAGGAAAGGTNAVGGAAAGGAGSTAAAKIDPATGQLITGDGTTGSGSQDLVGQPTTLAADQSTAGLGAVLYVLVIALLLILLAGPVLLGRVLARRNEAKA